MKNKRIVRCFKKMKPVFDVDVCDEFRPFTKHYLCKQCFFCKFTHPEFAKNE